jgi:hypothetical protein
MRKTGDSSATHVKNWDINQQTWDLKSKNSLPRHFSPSRGNESLLVGSLSHPNGAFQKAIPMIPGRG